MAPTKQPSTQPEPRGLGTHTRGLASEYAHEQGWGLEEEQRIRLAEGIDDTAGGNNYNYGAQDFGDEPINEDRFVSTRDTPPPPPDSPKE